MAVRIVRLGTPRAAGEGMRIGAVRRPPRGVRKSEYARRDYYDLWLPELAPSAKWVSWALSQPWTDPRWKRYAANYRREMRDPVKQRLLNLLARFSQQADYSVGCYCEREDRCHRAILRQLLIERGAKTAKTTARRRSV